MAMCIALSVVIPSSATAEESELFLIAPPAYKTGNPDLDPTIKLGDGETHVHGRRLLISEKAHVFEKGGEVSGSVTFVEGNGTYSNALTVAIHTDGSQKGQKAAEVLTGITVTFQTYKSRIVVRHMHGNDESPQLKQKKEIVMKNGVSYDFRVVYDTEKIQVWFRVSSKDPWADDPTLTVDVPQDAKWSGHHIGIYGREPVAGVKQVLKLRKLKLYARP